MKILQKLYPTCTRMLVLDSVEDSDPDLFGRIRTSGTGSRHLGPDPDPGLNKLHYLNFFGMYKSHKYFKHHCCLTFWFMKILFVAYFHQKILGKKFANNLFRSGSGRFQKSDPDPVKNRPDPQHWF
jgi:hypothetical protein